MRTLLDLFSGIGGMTLALQGVAKPIAYCEIDSDARAVLQRNMARGRLPDAPVYDDVRTFRNVPRADVVAAGFPCSGFSDVGKKRGFADGQSRLFFDMLRVIDAARPSLVFLENTPGILPRGIRVVIREFERRGYSLRWCVVAASDVGAPHHRKRWFCIAHRGALPEPGEFSGHAFSWAREPKTRMVEVSRSNDRRLFMLGNALVPTAARAAFSYMCCGEFPRRPPAGAPLVLDPAIFKSDREMFHGIGRVVTSAVPKALWATPIAHTTRANNYLTERGTRMLPTQVRFELSTPSAQRQGQVAPEFVEYLMGFPRGWTRLRR